MEIGRFQEQYNTVPFEIEPYGRIAIGRARGTVLLTECDAVAMQLVYDGNAVRLNVGGCQPINGNQCYIRNPYSTTVRGRYLRDHPMNFSQVYAETATAFFGHHQNTVSCVLEAGTGDNKTGLALIAKRGRHYLDVEGTSKMNTFLLPRADAAFLDLKPAAMLTTDLSVTRSDTSTNENYLAVAGTYTDAQRDAWIAATEWQDLPVVYRVNDSRAILSLPEGTGVFVSYETDEDFKANLEIYDQGDWSPEWVG